ncbi:FkbM family methyltransferase [Leeuwenhoekiella sp. W20_SRS_FM14]|uniref:FkbM family methyltransferase n=1 Tax=Leeuwenhoekiella sp. W20_SRS_FM14 TaxID=3240270 RepID=UPI003F947DB9
MIPIKRLVKKLFRRFGLKIIKTETKNYSDQNPFLTQYNLLENPEKEIIIFDVGAYVGEVTGFYRSLFPNAAIHSFEPFKESFDQLKVNTTGDANISLVNKALSNKSGKVLFNSNSFAQTNSLLDSDPNAKKTWSEGLFDTREKVSIETITLDDYVEANAIKTLDILKMDVQGGEFKVFQAASKTLSQKRIKMIYTEISIMPSYQGQPQFDEILSLLRTYGFVLYNLYGNSTTEKGQLRQVDALFILKDLIEEK